MNDSFEEGECGCLYNRCDAIVPNAMPAFWKARLALFLCRCLLLFAGSCFPLLTVQSVCSVCRQAVRYQTSACVRLHGQPSVLVPARTRACFWASLTSTDGIMPKCLTDSSMYRLYCRRLPAQVSRTSRWRCRQPCDTCCEHTSSPMAVTFYGVNEATASFRWIRSRILAGDKRSLLMCSSACDRMMPGLGAEWFFDLSWEVGGFLLWWCCASKLFFPALFDNWFFGVARKKVMLVLFTHIFAQVCVKSCVHRCAMVSGQNIMWIIVFTGVWESMGGILCELLCWQVCKAQWAQRYMSFCVCRCVKVGGQEVCPFFAVYRMDDVACGEGCGALLVSRMILLFLSRLWRTMAVLLMSSVCVCVWIIGRQFRIARGMQSLAACLSSSCRWVWGVCRHNNCNG